MPHIADPAVQKVLVRDFNRYCMGRWKQRFMAGMVPHQTELSDWWLDHRGPLPRYWQYVRHSACHWLANFNLELAKRVLPKRPWRILISDEHSTCWDGEAMLFDMNFMAFGIPANDCFAAANTDGKMLAIGEHLVTYKPKR